MKAIEKIDRNQTMIMSLDDMIDTDSNVRVIDAYVRSLDVKKLVSIGDCQLSIDTIDT